MTFCGRGAALKVFTVNSSFYLLSEKAKKGSLSPGFLVERGGFLLPGGGLGLSSDVRKKNPGGGFPEERYRDQTSHTPVP